MVRTLFVTSPARAAGKTLVALALVRALRRRGHRAVGVKPVDTGCAPGPDHDLLSIDGRHLQTASGPPDVPYTVIAPYRLGSALAPGPALAEAGLELNTAELARTVSDAQAWGEVVIVEGPWSALAPITADGLALDLARELTARVIVVVADGARALAEARETLAEVEARGLELHGVVLSAVDRSIPPAATAARAAELSEALPGVTVLAIEALEGDLEARVSGAEKVLEPWARAPYSDPRPS